MACDWLLIDGSSLIFRAYYARRAKPASDDGPEVNAVRGFLEALARLIRQRRPRHLAVADDQAWRPSWRVELIPSYKSHRVAEPVPAGLVPQLPVIQELLDAFGIDVVGVADHEAEDVIATWCRLAPGTVEIASGDRDLFALVEDPRVRVLYPDKAGLTVIDEGEVTRRYGIPGRRYADFAILRGDPSDGLPGLKGVGSVTAAGMIRRYGDIGSILRDRPLRDADREYLASAMRVVPPVADLPIALPSGRRDAYPDDGPALLSLAAQYGVRESCGRLLAAVGILASGGGDSAYTPRPPTSRGAAMRSRAAVLYGVKQEFQVEEIEVADPQEREVMVRVVATGICHSDHHLVTGDIGVAESAYPMVAGHEGAGVVEKTGPGCRRVKVGDHVVLTFIPSCGHCRWCVTGQQMLCDVGAAVLGGRQLDGTTRMTTLDGRELGQWVNISTFSEWTTCPEESCVVVSKHLPLDKIGLVGCGVPTGFGSVVNRANLAPGETVAVFGVGGVGMNAVQGAVLAGASRIIAVDVVPFKLEMAANFGATHFVNAREENPVQRILAITDGLGADKSIVTVGVASPDDVGNAVKAVRKGGRAVLTAMPKVEYEHINVSPTELGLFQKELVGSLYGTSNTQYDVPRLLDLYDVGKLKIDELVTRNYPLEAINTAFDDMLAGVNIRGMIVF